MTLDFTRARLPLFQHQREDIEALLRHDYFFIASQMRTGKTAIAVVGAQFLFEADLIDRVVVVAPAPVRDVWADQTLGEIGKHSFLDVPASIVEVHARIRGWLHGPREGGVRRLEWYVTNFEFVRAKPRLHELLTLCNMRTMLVLDESSFVGTIKTQQTDACLKLREACGRVVLINGTPIFHSPLNLLSQGNILSPSILAGPDGKPCTKSLFLARYAVQRPVLGRGGKPLENPRWPGHPLTQIAGWTNLEDLQQRFAHCTVRRLQAECLDLPPKLDPVTLTATLTPATWKAYRQMRDELVVWLNTHDVSASATAAVKALRLSQITGGFLGGVEAARIDPAPTMALFDSLVLPGFNDNDERGADVVGATVDPVDALAEVASPPVGSVQLGREKLEVLLWFIKERLVADPNLKVVAWGRFRAEVIRAEAEVRMTFPQMTTAVIMGGQRRDERLYALSLLKPETAPKGPVFIAGIEGTGSFGLDMCAAHTCITMSSGYSPGKSAQTLDRVYGPAQTHPIAYYDIVAVGPKGQRTIDFDILVTRRAGEDVATRTSAAWVKSLMEE